MSKAETIVIDLETYRTNNGAAIERITAEVLAKRPANNVKKGLKLEWDTEEAREARVQDALDKTALDPLLCQVLCAGVKVDDSETRGVWEGGAASAELIELLDEAAGPDTVWVGHNVRGFDLPVLLSWWLREQCVPPEHFPRFCGRHWRGRIYDTMLQTPSANPLGFIGLEAACEAYRIETPKRIEWDGSPLDGSRVGAAYEAGAHDRILEYCTADVEATYELYQALTSHGFYSPWGVQSEAAEAVAEIEASELGADAKRLAIYNVLDAAGLIPRIAA